MNQNFNATTMFLLTRIEAKNIFTYTSLGYFSDFKTLCGQMLRLCSRTFGRTGQVTSDGAGLVMAAAFAKDFLLEQ